MSNAAVSESTNWRQAERTDWQQAHERLQPPASAPLIFVYVRDFHLGAVLHLGPPLGPRFGRPSLFRAVVLHGRVW